ncbi:hypothetical protein [Baekduia soli]|uniref:hypothetical protein n=1 Tax=Baekduia soli TaxID=496014 RepID=UPI0016520004|nr:hypothetical protein [Baekduia soli]
MRVGLGETGLALRALACVDAASRDDARLALRTVLCGRPEDLAVFDAAFAEVFGDAGGADAPGAVDLGDGVRLALPRVASPTRRASARPRRSP